MFPSMKEKHGAIKIVLSPLLNKNNFVKIPNNIY